MLRLPPGMSGAINNLAVRFSRGRSLSTRMATSLVGRGPSFCCACCVLLASCSLLFEATPLENADSGPDNEDSGPDEDSGNACNGWSVQPAHFDPCLIVTPGGPLSLDSAGAWTYDTTTGTLTDPMSNMTTPTSETINQPGGTQARLVSIDGFTIVQNATLRVEGSLPLIVVSWSTLVVDGTIDVSSGLIGTGAGANSLCSTPPIAGADDDSGGGGGGGFQGNGGDGGDGGGADNNGLSGIGIASAPSDTRGGCSGADGGTGDNPGAGVGGSSFLLDATCDSC